MRGREKRRRVWLGGIVAYAVGIGLAIFVLLLLQAQASGGKAASRGRLASAELPQASYGPSLAREATKQAGSYGWQTVFSETFESGIGAAWVTTDTSAADGGVYVWGTSPFTYVSGDHSAWCCGGGDDIGSLYTDSMESWLVSEPIDIDQFDSHVWDAEVRFSWWLDTSFGSEGRARTMSRQSIRRVSSPPPSGDWFGWGVLTDVTDLEAGRWTYVSGATEGWVDGALPLDAFLPAHEGSTSTVRIAFRFTSDDDGRVGRGAFVDDVALRVNYGYEVALPLVMNEPPMTATLSSRLQNGSFEEGWYDVAVGQVPDEWEWHWVDGETLPGSDDPARAPETRVLPQEQLPPHERDLFILDGTYCVKVFKSYAPIYAALSQDLSGLEVGREYRLSAPIYLDVFNWEGGKVAPDDPSAAQVRLGVGPADATWRDEDAISYGPWWNGDTVAEFYLSYNDFELEFTATDAEMTVYVEVFAKWGLENNGFFMDDFKLFLLP